MMLPKVAVDKIYIKMKALPQMRQRMTPHDKRWLMAVDKVYQTVGEEQQRLLQMHFEEGKTGLEVMEELCIERSTFYLWREQLTMQLALAAVESGALQIFFD